MERQVSEETYYRNWLAWYGSQEVRQSAVCELETQFSLNLQV